MIPVDKGTAFRYHQSMKTVAEQGSELLYQWFLERTGQPTLWKASQKAQFATPSFLRADARSVLTALGTPPVSMTVREEHGWLLVDLSTQTLDRFVEQLPMPTAPQDDLERRLFRYLRYEEQTLADDPTVLHTAMAASWASGRKWDAVLERRILSISHHLRGMERIRLEHRLCRVMKWIIWERRNDE